MLLCGGFAVINSACVSLNVCVLAFMLFVGGEFECEYVTKLCVHVFCVLVELVLSLACLSDAFDR